jgi:hypothetical protein
MIEDIISMLNAEANFIEIFAVLECTDEQFLEAINKQQETDSFTTVIHFPPEYPDDIVVY